MTPKKIIVKCTNVTMTAQSSAVQFTTKLDTDPKIPSTPAASTLLAVQFDKASEAKQFDIDNLYEITIADKK